MTDEQLWWKYGFNVTGTSSSVSQHAKGQFLKAIAEEREACAKVLDKYALAFGFSNDLEDEKFAKTVAAEIRRRGEE